MLTKLEARQERVLMTWRRQETVWQPMWAIAAAVRLASRHVFKLREAGLIYRRVSHIGRPSLYKLTPLGRVVLAGLIAIEESQAKKS